MSDPPTGPVEIVGVRGTAVWAEGRGSTVAVTLRNSSDEPVVADVWWLLAEPGDREPWASPAGKGRPKRLTLAGGDTGDVSVPTLVAPPPGTWTMSLWAHASRDGRRVPSHGVNVSPSVRVLSSGSDLRRVSLLGRRATISTLVAQGRLLGADGGRQAPDALASVQASTRHPTAVEVRCYLTTRPRQEPWSDPSAVVSRTETVVLDDDVVQEVPCRFSSLPVDGPWSLSAFVWRPDAFAPEDGVVLREQLDLAPEAAGKTATSASGPREPVRPAGVRPEGRGAHGGR